MGLTANSLYGFDPTAQVPTSTPTPDHQGAPEPTVAKTAGPGKAGSPILALVVILGLVVVLTQVSFRGTINVSG